MSIKNLRYMLERWKGTRIIPMKEIEELKESFAKSDIGVATRQEKLFESLGKREAIRWIRILLKNI